MYSLVTNFAENELVSCSPYSQSHFPSQMSEQTDEQVPVRSRLTFLTLIPRLRLMLCWAGQHRAGRWGRSCCSATLTAAAPKQILGSFSPTCVAASLEYMDQMKEAGLFAWKRHDLLPAGSAAAENKGRINPSSRPAWFNLFTAMPLWPMGGSWENQKKYWHNIASRRWDYKLSSFSIKLIVSIMGLNWFPIRNGSWKNKAKPSGLTWVISLSSWTPRFCWFFSSVVMTDVSCCYTLQRNLAHFSFTQ